MNGQPRASWLPLVIIAMAQIMMIFNIATLQVSIDGIASSFNSSATSIGSAIVAYSLVVAGFIMLGARIAQMLGSRRVFRMTVLAFGAAMAIMALSVGVPMMIAAQVAAGAAAAALVPTLVVLVADNYKGRQQEQALGWLGGAPAMGIVLAFLIAGSLATLLGWRVVFGLLVLFAAGIYKLSDKLSPAVGEPVQVDFGGVALAALSILFISVGSANLISWGTLVASPAAPFSFVDMSPAPIMILAGTAMATAFVIGILSVNLHANLVHNEKIPIELKSELNLDNVSFISNDQLRTVLARTSATPAQVEEAVLVNTDTRLVALKLTFLTFAGFALLAFFPAGALPRYERGEIPAEAQGAEPEEHPHERPGAPGVSQGAH